jgi:hypothetical protein
MIGRVVVNPEGMIIRLELLPPFSYLWYVTQRVQNSGRRSEHVLPDERRQEHCQLFKWRLSIAASNDSNVL